MKNEHVEQDVLPHFDPTVAAAIYDAIGKPENLEPLSVIENRIEANLLMIGKSKAEILKDLYEIYKYRSIYFIGEKLEKYQKDFPGYIKDRFQQSRSAYFDDAKVVKMVFDAKMPEVLDDPNKVNVHVLKRVSTAKNPVPLLEKIDELDRETVEIELKKQKGDNDPNFIEIKGLMVKMDEDGKGLLVSFENGNAPAEHFELLKKKVENLEGQKMRKPKPKKEKKGKKK